MNILGIGSIFSGGRGIKAFENSLTQGWQEPSEYELGSADRKARAYFVNPDDMEDRLLFKRMRRSDKLSRMAVLAAYDALTEAGIDSGSGDIGVILSTAFGAHRTTFGFLDDILDYGELQVSPTTFSNSVHNAAVSYISSTLNLIGPTLTITRFSFPFHSALQLASLWLEDGRCDYVLVGTADECGDVMRYAYDKKFGSAADGRIRPFHLSPSSPPVPGEGSLFFLVSRQDPERSYCFIDGIEFGLSSSEITGSGICIIDADGTSGGDGYLNLLSSGLSAAAYSPCFGSIPTGTSFNCAAGALMLRHQMQYSNPVLDNPHALQLVDGGPARIDLIRSIGYNCSGENAVISMKRF